MSDYMEFKGFRIQKLSYDIKNEMKKDNEKDNNIKFNIGYKVSDDSTENKIGNLLVSCYVDQFRENDKIEIKVSLE